VLDRIGDTLTTIDDVEIREQVDRAEWEADPAQPRWNSYRVTMRLLPLYDLQKALTNNPRGRASTT
jgi:hypothetical protein